MINGSVNKQDIIEKNHIQVSKSKAIPSAPDSSEGPGPTTSETDSGSGSLSCSDLYNKGICFLNTLRAKK